MADQITVSSTANPYQAGVYSAGSNSKNTMDVNSFIKLLAAQLSNQDMTSPMDNSEMMSQMTNMAMVQSLTAMTKSLNTSAAVTTQSPLASICATFGSLVALLFLIASCLIFKIISVTSSFTPGIELNS